MNARSKFAGFLLFSVLLFSLAWTANPSPLVAQDVVVSAAVPDNAPQGMVSLNVQVKGNGFKKGAVAKWLVTGSEIDSGGVTVNSTTYVSSTDLIANINVTSDAQTEKKYDIKVTLSSGRTGKGIELFRVIYSPPDPAIAYIVGSAFNGDLSVMNADGTNRLTLIKEDKLLQNSQPSWSPDGSQLVFVRDDGFYQGWIYVVNKDGSNPHQVVELSNYSSAQPVWSPAPLADGQYKILFSDQLVPGGLTDLFLVNLDGTGLVNLTNTPGSGEFKPTWDPTATRFAANVYPCTSICTPHLYEYSLGLTNGVVGITGETTDLTATGPLQNAHVFHPQWAKTQDKIVLSAQFPDDTNNSDLWVIELDDPANPVRLTWTSGAREISPSWSADDSKIVYIRNAPRNSKIKSGMFGIYADGSGATGDGYPADGTMPDWRRCCPECATVCAP